MTGHSEAPEAGRIFNSFYTPPNELKDYINKDVSGLTAMHKGYNMWQFSKYLAETKNCVRRGHTPIILIRSGCLGAHYVVVVGYDKTGNFLVEDYDGLLIMTAAEFRELTYNAFSAVPFQSTFGDAYNLLELYPTVKWQVEEPITSKTKNQDGTLGRCANRGETKVGKVTCQKVGGRQVADRHCNAEIGASSKPAKPVDRCDGQRWEPLKANGVEQCKISWSAGTKQNDCASGYCALGNHWTENVCK